MPDFWIIAVTTAGFFKKCCPIDVFGVIRFVDAVFKFSSFLSRSVVAEYGLAAEIVCCDWPRDAFLAFGMFDNCMKWRSESWLLFLFGVESRKVLYPWRFWMFVVNEPLINKKSNMNDLGFEGKRCKISVPANRSRDRKSLNSFFREFLLVVALKLGLSVFR